MSHSASRPRSVIVTQTSPSESLRSHRRHNSQFKTDSPRSGSSSPASLEDDVDFDRNVVKFLTIKNQPYAVSGRIPIAMRDLTLFFRVPKGTSHSIDFPIDLDDGPNPAFSLLLETCKAFTEELEQVKDAPSHPLSKTLPFPRVTPKNKSKLLPNPGPYVFPPHLPLSTTLDISKHPILDTVRDVLFPNLPAGHYLVAERASLEMAPEGARSRALLPEETPPDRVATIFVTLPVRFRGGALVVSHPEDAVGIEERFRGRGGKAGDLEWTAFLGDSEFGLEPVDKGCHMSFSYNVRLKSFGASGPNPQPLVIPNDRILDAMVPLFTRAKGQKLGFFLSGNYSVLPPDAVADTVVPQLKGSDALLYHAAKLYNFNVELRYAAGGFIWAAQQTIQLSPTGSTPISPASSSSSSGHHQERTINRRIPLSDSQSIKSQSSRHRRSSTHDEEERYLMLLDGEGRQDIQSQVEASGALKLSDAGVSALTARSRSSQGPVTRLPVPFICNGTLNRLWVNVLMVIWVP